MKYDSNYLNLFNPSVAFHTVNQMTGFYRKCNIELKCVKKPFQISFVAFCERRHRLWKLGLSFCVRLFQLIHIQLLKTLLHSESLLVHHIAGLTAQFPRSVWHIGFITFTIAEKVDYF